MSARVIGIAGWKNSGKTTLVVRLVAELTRRGWRVSTIKHAHHDADIDHEGTDSFRHRQAGAGEVILATGRRWALMHELREGEEEASLDALLARLGPCDLVIVEGFRHGDHAKIETRRRAAADHAPLPASANVLAIAADHAVEDAAVPVFSLDAIPPIADFIETALAMR
jgi:molybdopterin-guanine dinucleotide biosynthesis protein B